MGIQEFNSSTKTNFNEKFIEQHHIPIKRKKIVPFQYISIMNKF